MSEITLVKSDGGKQFSPIPAAKHDAVLHAVIEVGVHPKTFKGDTKSSSQVKFVFELVNEKDDSGMTRVLGKQVKASLHEKSKFMEIARALLKSDDNDAIVEKLSGATGISDLIGLPAVVTVKQFTGDNGNAVSYIDSVTELDARLPNQPVAVREGFVFSPFKDDAVKVFKKNLTNYTRDLIMSAENASDFPAELHEADKSLREDDIETKVLG